MYKSSWINVDLYRSQNTYPLPHNSGIGFCFYSP